MPGGWEDTSKPKKKGFKSSGGPAPAGSGGGAVGPAPVVSNSGGSYSRPSAPPSGGMGGVQQIAQPQPPMSINQWLGHDTQYLSQKRDFQNALAGYLSTEKMQKGKINEDYASANKSMGVQKTQDLGNIQSDYASRGLLNSGLFADANAKYNADFLQRLAELTKNQRRGLGDLMTGETNFRKQQQLEEQRAREQAIARRATKYGL